MVTAPIHYIDTDERGIAYLAGSRMKVRQIIAEMQAWGHTPPEIQEGHPTLSLAQIYAALSYYHDHKEQIDAELAEIDREYDSARAQQTNPLTRQELETRPAPQK